jgi:xanthine dehydrogenase accessory factor
MTWARQALDLIARGEPVAMVTLAHVAGSAPRDAGTRMIVSRDAIFGTVGGGNLELQLTDQARRLLVQSAVDVMQQDYPLGPLLAQCCGGRVRVLIERLAAESRAWLAAADEAERAGARYTLEGRIMGGFISRHIARGWTKGDVGVDLFGQAGERIEQKGVWSRTIERIAPVATPLYLFGAGHVGKAIAHIATTLPFRFHWLDSRPEMATEDPCVTVCKDLVSLVDEAPSGAFFLVVTHAHELDYALVRAILRRGDASFCGLIGSATKRARFVSRLAKDNVDARDLVCPIGGEAIRSKEPVAIAVGVAAELLVTLEALTMREPART